MCLEFVPCHLRLPRPVPRAVTFAWQSESTYSDRYIDHSLLPPHHFHGITDLELIDYPRCRCHDKSSRGHSKEFLPFHLPTLFPDLRRLHIRTPYILKNLAPHRNLEVITIEAPRVHYLAAFGYYSTLLPWNIAAALSAGLLRRDDQGSLKSSIQDISLDSDKDAVPTRKIVANTGPEKPLGWKEVLFACEKHNVEL